MRGLAKDGRPGPIVPARGCWLGTLKYYADRIAGAVTYLRFFFSRLYCIVYALENRADTISDVQARR